MEGVFQTGGGISHPNNADKVEENKNILQLDLCYENIQIFKLLAICSESWPP